jgi:hypothetical protein
MYKCSSSRRFGGLSVCVAVLLLFLGNTRLQAVGTFIPATNRIDMVHDAGRDVLYITAAGQVLRYHLGSASFLTPFDLGGSLYGIDLSPDGNTLAVADRTQFNTNAGIHLIDLPGGTARRVDFPRNLIERGTFTVAFGGDGALLITGAYEGSGRVPMLRYDPASGATRVITNLFRSAMLRASGDGTVIGFIEASNVGGRSGLYGVVEQDVLRTTSAMGWATYDVGVSRDGSQIAVPTYGGTWIYDEHLHYLRTIGVSGGGRPVGATYHPTADVVFFSWATTREVRAYDITTWQQIASFDFEYTFPPTESLSPGRLRISRDGTTLFCSVPGGVRYYRHDLNAPVYRRLDINGDPRRIGTPTPTPYGTNWLPVASVVTNQVTSIAEFAGVRYVCTGWSGTGSVPSNGTSTRVVFTLDDNSTLTWHWTPVAYQLSVNVAGSGSVNSTGAWFNFGQTTTLVAAPASDYRFVRWFGDVPLADSTNNPIQLVMDRGRRVTALFARQSSSEGYLPGDWPTYGRSASHQGYFQGVLGNARFTNRWSLNTGAYDQVAVGQGRVFVSRETPEFSIGAIDPVSGLEMWRYPLPAGRFLNPPAYYQGNIYVERGETTNNARLFSIDAATGQLNWSASVGWDWEDHMAPTVVDEAVYLSAYGFDRSTGSRLFYVSLGWTPTFHNGRLYSWIGEVFREHNPQTGAIGRTLDLDSSPTAEIIERTTAAADGRAYMIGQGDLFAVDLETHSLLWQKEGLGYFRGTPAIANGIVYANSNNAVVAFTAHDGEYVGTYTGTERLTSPLIATDDILLAGSDNQTFVFDLATFSVRQTLPVGGQLSLADGTLYIAESGPYVAQRGRLHAYSTGQDVRLIVAGDPVAIGMLGPNAYGTNYLPRGDVITNSVLSFVETNRSRYNCLGWSGTGSVPGTGTGNQVVFTLTTNSTLTWRWQPTAYLLEAGVAGFGTVNFSNGWINAGTSITLRATPRAGYRFLGWAGDVSGATETNNPLTVIMDRPRRVTAVIGAESGLPLEGGWPTFGNGPAHSGYLPGVLGNASFHLRWERLIPGTLLQHVAVGGDRVFVTPSYYPNNAFLGAYHAYTGQPLWQRTFADTSSINPPTYHDGAVFMQRAMNYNMGAHVWSFDAATGRTNWQAPYLAQSGRYRGSMASTVADEMVWVNDGGGMYGFSRSNGVRRFLEQSVYYDGWTPTYYNQKLYSFVDSRFREHDPLTGEVNWTLSFGPALAYGGTATVVADGGYGFVYTLGSYGTNGPGLVAVDLAARRVSWQVPGSFSGFPAAANGIVYAISNSVVVAYSARDGEFIGSYTANEPLSNDQPIVAADTLFVSGGDTYVFDLATFALRQTLATGGRLSLANGVLYVAGQGRLRAYSTTPELPLVVQSNSGPFGEPSPAAYGTNPVPSGVNFTTGVTTPWPPGSSDVRYVNIGWTGTGSVPATGTTNAVTFTMSAASSLTWRWKAQCFLNVFVISNGTVSLDAGWHDVGTVLSLTATPSNYFHFVNWGGSVSGTSPTTSVVVNGPGTVVAYFAEDLTTNGVPQWWLAQYGISPDGSGDFADPDGDSLPNWREYAVGSHPLNGDTDGDGYGDGVEVTWNSLPNNAQSIPRARLIIEGRPAPYGNAQPLPYGANLVALFRSVTNRVTSPVAGPSNSVRLISTGWTGTGIVPASGNSNPVTFMVTTNCTLTWNWATQYLLVTAGTSNGTIRAVHGTNSSPDEWWLSGSLLTLTAVPSNFFYFANWAGELSGSNNPASLLMDKPRFIQAIFAPNMRTNGVPEWWLAAHGLPITDAATLADSDGDGHSNAHEWKAGTTPNDPSSVLRLDGSIAMATYRVSWPSTAGRTYRLWSSTNLAGPFATVANGIAATPPINIYQPAASSAAQRFYKIEVE